MPNHSSPLATYFRDHWRWIILIVIVGLGIGFLFDFLYAKAFEETYGIFAQSHKMDQSPPESVRHLAASFAILSAGIFMAFIEIFHFAIHLQQQLLRKLEIDEDEKRPTLLRRLMDRFDPVDEATVKELRTDLPMVTDYFGSITHVHARSWFAGENYLTLLLCQAHELLKRKHQLVNASTPEEQSVSTATTPSPSSLELFRIVVWRDRWFNQKQSIALLRIFYFFLQEFEIPLKTYILTQRRFNRLLTDPQVPPIDAQEIEVKGQFWVCKRRMENQEELTLVYGKRAAVGEPETPQRVDDQKNCEQCMDMLEYLRKGSLPLEKVFTDLGVIYDDKEVTRRLRAALKQLESPVPTYR